MGVHSIVSLDWPFTLALGGSQPVTESELVVPDAQIKTAVLALLYISFTKS